MKNIRNNILFLTIGIVISVSISYCFADTLIDSKDVYYKDSRELGYNNVQDAIDGTCTRFDNAISNLKEELLNQTYPIGSIYISTSLDTNEKVGEALGGTWEVYGNGRTLLSSTGESEKTGGQATAVLTASNIPSHTHDYDKVNSETKSHVLTKEEIPGEVPRTSYFPAGTWSLSTWGSYSPTSGFYGSTLADKVGWEWGRGHTHPIATTKTQTTSYGSTNPTAINVQDPYITVYMYKRIA